MRASNEDDYLLFAPEAEDLRGQVGVLCAVADGMGGVSGGGEASRAAVRALVEPYAAAADGGSAPDRMAAAFRHACAHLFELSRHQPRLRDMGTTLTALNVVGGQAILGHVGDSRCYRLREGRLEQLTKDHALRAAEHQLTRCVGAGRAAEEVDLLVEPLAAGDTFLLCTDGLWDPLGDDVIRELLGSGSCAAAARELVRRAVVESGVDNCTAIVIRVRAVADDASMPAVEVDLPGRETNYTPAITAALPALRRPRWPWAALVVAALIAVAALARLWLGFDLTALLVA